MASESIALVALFLPRRGFFSLGRSAAGLASAAASSSSFPEAGSAPGQGQDWVKGQGQG